MLCRGIVSPYSVPEIGAGQATVETARVLSRPLVSQTISGSISPSHDQLGNIGLSSHELVPDLDPHTLSGIKGLPCWLHWFTLESHPGLLRGSVSFPNVTPDASHHTINPGVGPTFRAGDDVIDSKMIPARLRLTILTGIMIPLHEVGAGECDRLTREAVIITEAHHLGKGYPQLPGPDNHGVRSRYLLDPIGPR